MLAIIFSFPSYCEIEHRSTGVFLTFARGSEHAGEGGQEKEPTDGGAGLGGEYRTVC